MAVFGGCVLLALGLLLSCGGDEEVGSAVPLTATAASVPVRAAPRKGIDGLLVAAPRKFRDVVPRPRVAEVKQETEYFAAYDVTGPYDDVDRFYLHHLPEAARTKEKKGVKLALPPGPDRHEITVRLQRIAFEHTRIVVTVPPPAGTATDTADPLPPKERTVPDAAAPPTGPGAAGAY